MEKLIQIQQELKAPKSKFNSFGKYAYRNAEDILTAAKPLLAKYECTLTLTDEIVQIGSRVYVKATAEFSDGDKLKTVSAYAREPEAKKGMDDSQITGTASSYARKYALNGLFLIDDVKDADSDEYRNEADARGQTEDVGDKPIGKVKAKALEKRCDDEGIDYAKVCAMLKVSRFEDITEYNHRVLCDKWETVKERCKVE